MTVRLFLCGSEKVKGAFGQIDQFSIRPNWMRCSAKALGWSILFEPYKICFYLNQQFCFSHFTFCSRSEIG